MSRKRTALFFARGPVKADFSRFEFYAQDIRVLRELGYEVKLASGPTELRPADLYVAWWWTWAFMPVAFARLVRRPVVVTGTFDYWLFPSRPLHERALMRFSLAHADRNVFVSSLEYEQVPRMARVNEPRLVPHSVDGQLYRPGAGPRTDTVFTLATMGADNGVRKCVAETIRAAALVHEQFPELRFVLAGRPDPKFLRLAAELGAERYLELPGTLSVERKLELMQTCKLYLAPSRFEGFGLAIAEAMCCGAPVVTSPVGELPRVVGDAAKFVDGEDPVDIARGVTDLLRDDAAREALGRRGSERIRRLFSYEQHREAWARILAEL